MSAPAKELLGRFPIDLLCFIFSAGLLLTLSSPIDLLNLNFSNGVDLNPTEFWNYIQNNFAPFVTLTHLANSQDFAYNVTMILFISLFSGTLIFYIQDCCDVINRKIMRGRAKRLLHFEEILKNRASDPNKGPLESIEFNKWAKREGLDKSLEFLWSLRQASTGLLYAFEAFSLIVLIITVLSSLQNWTFWRLEWMIGAPVFVVLFYLFYLAFELQFMKRIGAIWNAFKARPRLFSECCYFE